MIPINESIEQCIATNGRIISEYMPLSAVNIYRKYSEIPLLRPPKIKTFYPLKTLFAKFR